jgi:hypothetical protein
MLQDGLFRTRQLKSAECSRRAPNGGSLRGRSKTEVALRDGLPISLLRGCRFPHPDTDEDAIAALFVASLGLLMTDSVTLTNVEVFAEPHKGTRGGPSDHSREGLPAAGRLVELNYVIRAGMVTYPGLPGPQITPYLTREASRGRYAAGTEFAIDRRRCCCIPATMHGSARRPTLTDSIS